MLAAHFDLGVDVLKAGLTALFVDVDHAAADVEEGDHLVDPFVHHQGVRFARWLKDVAARGGNPVVLQVTPRAFDDIPMHEKLLWSLEDMQHVVTVPEEIRVKARRAIDRMLALG